MNDSAPPRVDTLTRLFAYGTLMTGLSRRALLGSALLEGPGRVRGGLYDFDEYPGLVLDDSGWVVGELYDVPDLATRVSTLDRAEWYDPTNEAGSLYLRRVVPVHVTSGGLRPAWVYAYNGSPRRGPRISSGDWRVHATARAVSSPAGS